MDTPSRRIMGALLIGRREHMGNLCGGQIERHYGRRRWSASRWIDTVKLAASSCLLWLAVCAVSGYSLSTRPPVIREIGSVADSRPADQWFIAEASRITRLLGGDAKVGWIDVTHGRSLMKTGFSVETIHLDCADSRGEHRATILWDSSSRALISV